MTWERRGREGESGCVSAPSQNFSPLLPVGKEGRKLRSLPRAPIASMYSMQETYKLPHRLIEKKRRDRINECIAQLKDLLPEHLKLTVSEKLAALQPSSSAQRADGGVGVSLAACRRHGELHARRADQSFWFGGNPSPDPELPKQRQNQNHLGPL